jgi:hypothetical protein
VRRDKRLLVVAAGRAQRASDYILGDCVDGEDEAAAAAEPLRAATRGRASA